MMTKLLNLYSEYTKIPRLKIKKIILFFLIVYPVLASIFLSVNQLFCVLLLLQIHKHYYTVRPIYRCKSPTRAGELYIINVLSRYVIDERLYCSIYENV